MHKSLCPPLLMSSITDKLLLDGHIEDYEYLNKSRREVDGVDDKEDWNTLKVGLKLHWVAIHRLRAYSLLWMSSVLTPWNSSTFSALWQPFFTLATLL